MKRRTAFESYHPGLAVAYFTAVLVFCMAAFQPIFIVLSLLGALSCEFYLSGWRKALKTIAWQLPLVALVAIINPFISASGSTELFRVGVSAIYLESLMYGLCMGMMLMAVMLWFSAASRILTSDKVMGVLGNRLPLISLMVSMTLRLVPRFLERRAAVQLAQDCCAPAQLSGFRQRIGEGARLTSVLMGWSMEDSLETADAMRARGWGESPRRTVYARYRMHARDRVAALTMAALVMLCAVCAFTACSGYEFYPVMGRLAWWWGYVPYAVLVFAPMLLQAGEWFSWRR